MKLILASLTLLMTLSVNAAGMDVRCTGTTLNRDQVELVINNNQVQIHVVQDTTLKEKILGDVWDGHIAGLLTGQGFAIKYANNYGCITDVEVTTVVKGHLTTLPMSHCTTIQNGGEYCNR